MGSQPVSTPHQDPIQPLTCSLIDADSYRKLGQGAPAAANKPAFGFIPCEPW
jgi:hypothetical protein